jgi:hypothetical protein
VKNAALALLTSIVRTVTPAIVGFVVSWFTSRGITPDPELETNLALIIALVATGLYYVLVRLLETYVTPRFGWLLGVAKSPAAYTPESPARASDAEIEQAVAVELAK